ncbi:hypothetical protein HYFRA_00013518 [Hymenoscyphus fraxineus]|uniref:Uncharacterized protein n=1 Tax=Hymenoscyphus fraxineus TaxID=746836 RepID=A0A9N9L5D4_9HELO|nr:hypothetical protein HYFRA_00013518 [Hymenoscyphus fraxineus]
MAPNATNTIQISPPTRFHPTGPKLVAPPPPPLTWLERTWNVTHSTLPMWKRAKNRAKNVRITYKILPREDGKGCCLDDEVVYDDIDGKPEGCFERWLGMRQIRGVDWWDGTEEGEGEGEGKEDGKEGDVREEGMGSRYRKWHWKGRGWLFITGGSKWEILGWGEVEGERWIVTWFEASLFTSAGLDIYSEGREGLSAGLYEEIMRNLEDVGELEGCEELGKIVKGMFGVKIDL